jgi:hypothetical protein
MAEPTEPNKPIRPADSKSGMGGKAGKGGSAESPFPQIKIPSGWSEPKAWDWHITETFKGLITLSIELVKMLALVNGGALVALLAYLGNVAAHPIGGHLPHLRHALGYFCNGLFATVVAVIVAYLTQLRLYHEERKRHLNENFKVLHPGILAVGILLAGYAAFAFLKGCLVAASAIAS